MYDAHDIHKQFGGVKALAGVSLSIRPGEVHALLGANGAGKSTLVKILAGAETPTSGELTLDGKPVKFSDVGEAADHGVAIVSQELNLFPDFDVLHNLFLLREPRRVGLISRAEMRRLAKPVVERVGLNVDLDRKLATLRLGEQQLVEVARALLNEPKILILDEPNSALQKRETDRLLSVVRALRDEGVGIIYVSHFLEDVFAVADCITIVRNGQVVAERVNPQESNIKGVVDHMLGEAAPDRNPRRAERGGEPGDGPPLALSGVSVDGALKDVNITARPGEIVGLAGLEGSGVSTVLEVVFGRRKPTHGSITLPNGRDAPSSMAQAVRRGIAYVPSDRKRLGVMLTKPIYENVTAVSGTVLGRLGQILRTGIMVQRAERWGEQLRVRMASTRSPVGDLSGGNQQKVVFAKWLDADPEVVLLDDPSRGVDVGAKVEMHQVIESMADQGKVVLMASTDLDELTEVCDRVLVFFQGRLVGEFVGEVTEHELMEAINTGVVPAHV